MSSHERTPSLPQNILGDIAAQGGVVAVPQEKVKQDVSKAIALTAHAINNLGGPVYASMTDHKPKDGALDQAKIMMAVNKQGVIAVPEGKAPVDRAITEALTLRAISAGKELKKTEVAERELDLKALQEDALREKAAKDAARKFGGGGDNKAIMQGLLGEINEGGVISVPAGKAPETNVALNHAKALMEIAAMKGECIYASGTDGKAEDKGLNQAKMLGEIKKAPTLKKVETKDSSVATTQALNMLAISGAKPTLKKVE
jgi:hypothetical protein